MKSFVPLALVALPAALGVACDADVPGSEDRLPRSACAIAVVASDYRSSSSISLLAADGRPCATDIVHSGSRPPGLLTALSGDVVLPTVPPAAGAADDVILVDRYPNGIVTRLDPVDDAVEGQYAVAPGFPGNPQDVVRLDATTALVARLERNPDAALDPIDLDDGSDLLIIDWSDGTPLGRIALDAAAEPGFDPMPTRLARTGALVWAGLAHLTYRFTDAGPGRVVAVDPTARALVATVPLPAFVNCAHVAADPGGRGVWAVCSGLFARGGQPQITRSGLAWIDAETRAVAWQAGASQLHAGDAPLGFALAALDDTRALVVALGDKDLPRPDRLLLVDRTTGAARPLLESGAFELACILPSPAAGLVLVAVADDEAPRIERLGLDADFAPLPPITAYSATGLEPRQLAFFR